jgi:hypothetical protein
MEHKHADVITAWSNGAEIQVLNQNGEWVDVVGGVAFYNFEEFRIKPNIRTCRVALIEKVDGKGFMSVAADCIAQEGWLSGNPRFVRWITDRIKYEV